MNEKHPSPSNSVNPSEISNDRFTFEQTHFEYGNRLDKYGAPEVIDVTEVFTAHIVHPDLGQILEGSLVYSGHEHNGHYHAILENVKRSGYFAVRTAVLLSPEGNESLQIRPVVLHHPVRNEWELFRYKYGSWQLIPGQHLKAKTATAQQWLGELETQIMPNLDLQAAELFKQRIAIQASRQAINPTGEEHLSPDTAASNARIEWLGPDYHKNRHARQTAERRCTNADVALRRHAVSTPEIAPIWSAVGRWWSHARKGKRLHVHAKKARACHQRLADKCLAFETSVIPEKGENWIKERTQELLKADSDTLKHIKFLTAEKEALATQMSEAAKLTRLLKQQSPDTLVIMDQSQVTERRFQTVPVLRIENTVELKMTSANRMRP